jgi:hypothetical protein
MPRKAKMPEPPKSSNDDPTATTPAPVAENLEAPLVTTPVVPKVAPKAPHVDVIAPRRVTLPNGIVREDY